MNSERLYSILREPHVTEKVTDIGDKSNQYAFKVSMDATKGEIREAVQKLYDVTVENVTTVRVKGKQKRRMYRNMPGKDRSSWKKAYVRLQEGDRIDFTQEVS